MKSVCKNKQGGQFDHMSHTHTHMTLPIFNKHYEHFWFIFTHKPSTTNKKTIISYLDINQGVNCLT